MPGPWPSAARGKTHVEVEELPAEDHLMFYCEGPFEAGRFRAAKLLSESPLPAWPRLCPRGPAARQQPFSAQGLCISEGAALEGMAHAGPRAGP